MLGEDSGQVSVPPAKIPLETRQQSFYLLVGKRLDPGEDFAGSLHIPRKEQPRDDAPGIRL